MSFLECKQQIKSKFLVSLIFNGHPNFRHRLLLEVRHSVGWNRVGPLLLLKTLRVTYICLIYFIGKSTIIAPRNVIYTFFFLTSFGWEIIQLFQIRKRNRIIKNLYV